MDPLAWIVTTDGRLAPKPFALGVLGVYVAGIATQALLSGNVMARAGLTPFILAQAALIWLWLLLHIKRLRDAGQGPASAIGVAVVYTLAIGLLIMLVAFFTNPNAGGSSTGSEAGDAAAATLLVVFLFAIVFKPDFGVFTTILKGLIVIAFLPAMISLLFSLRTGLRRRVP
jgi:uncharacterized membrane protein YhaH (DUF805 family)